MSHKQYILIVDDNHINRQFFSMSLEKADFQITTAEDGFKAIDLAKTNPYDLILMDIRMPEIDGYETAKQIRLLANHQKTPILATSAESLVKDKQKCFDDFLLKPISPKLLVQKVKSHCPQTIEQANIFNQQDALKYAYNDKDIMNKLISLFIDDLPIQMSALDDYLIQQDKHTCIDIIHKIRGSCKACGAQELETQLVKLSDCIKDGCKQEKSLVQEVKLAVENYLSFNLIKHH